MNYAVRVTKTGRLIMGNRRHMHYNNYRALPLGTD